MLRHVILDKSGICNFHCFINGKKHSDNTERHKVAKCP